MGDEGRATEDVLAAAKLDKSVLTVGTSDDDDTRAYWASRTVEERLEAMELMRMINYGYDPVNDRVERVLEIVDLEDS